MAALNMPSGFRFHPTDMELIQDYLARKCYGLEPAAPIVAEIDMYNYDPWILPEFALYGEREWFFFCPTDRKSPAGVRPNRTAGTGYWRATGPDKPIGHPPIGNKKSLVFFTGKSPQGFRTNWMMQEYRLVTGASGKKDNHRLDRWVLCRLYNKKGFIEKYMVLDQNVVQVQEVRDLKRPMVQAKRDPAALVKRDSKVDHQGVGRKPNEQLPLRNWLPQQVDNWVTPAMNCIVTHQAVQIDVQPVASFPGFMFDAEAIKMEEELEKQLQGFDYSLEGLLDDDELHGGSTVTQVQEMMNDSMTMQHVPGINPWQPMQLPEIQYDTYMYPSPKRHAP